MTKREHYETKQDRIVFQSMLNDQKNLFGGLAMQWMDEVAYITAKRYTRENMVTVSVNDVKFIHPVKEGMIVVIIGKIKRISSVRLEVLVEIFTENIHKKEHTKSIEGTYVFSCINDKTRKPIRLPDTNV